MFKKYLIFIPILSLANELYIDEIDKITNTIITDKTTHNQGIIVSDNNKFSNDFINYFGATLGGSKSNFNIVYNDGFFEGEAHIANTFHNNGYFLSSKTTIEELFVNYYEGMIDSNDNNFSTMQNYGLIYGDNHTFNDFTNYYDGWFFGNNATFKGDVVNDANGLISGNNLSFEKFLQNNSYIFVDDKASFNEVGNDSLMQVNNASFEGKVINNSTIDGEHNTFKSRLENNLDSVISGEYLSFQNTYNNGMILGDFIDFYQLLDNDLDGWVIGSNINFKEKVINNGDLIGAYFDFNKLLENNLNIDSMYSTFNDIKNTNYFSTYKSDFKGTITQSDNAYFYANGSEILANFDGGNIEIAYSTIDNEKLLVNNAKINNSTINSKHSTFNTLIIKDSSIYGGFRAKNLDANNNNFVVYFSDGFSGAIVVDEKISGTNNDIKIINYQNNTGFFPILLAKSNKDLSNDFSIYTIKGFSVFGFDKEVVVKKVQNGAFLLGLGDFNALNISDINELFNDKNTALLENNAKNKIKAFNPEIAKIGVDKKLINNIKDKFYKEEMLNYAISRLNFDSNRFDFLNYEFISGDINDINYQINLAKLNKSNEYNYFYNDLGIFLYELKNEKHTHKIYGGGFYANFNFNDFYINTDFKYSEHNTKINLNELGLLDKDYFSINSKFEFGLKYQNIFVYRPNIALIYEYLPKTKFKNEDIKAILDRQNNTFLKLGFDIAYLNNDAKFSLSSNYFINLSKDRKLHLFDGYSKINESLPKANNLEIALKTQYLINEKLNINLDLSKTFLNEFNSYAFKLGLGYSF